jgi:GNAT superfamily N-acetyltransferase
MPIEIRDATLHDAEFIADANCRLALESEGLKLDPVTALAGVRALLQDSARGSYFIAMIDDAPAGQIMITYEWSDWRNGNIWWIQSVFTLPAHRRKGVFRALYRHVERRAREGAAVALRLYVEKNNQAAQSAYVNLGMEMSHYLVMEEMFTS